jgi:DME family drug/metabolite transporter
MTVAHRCAVEPVIPCASDITRPLAGRSTVVPCRTVMPEAIVDPTVRATTPAEARRGVLEVLGAAVLFGTTGTSATFAPATAGSVAIGAARLVIGGLVLLMVLPRLGGRRGAVLAAWRTPVGLLAGVMTALYQLAFFAGVSLAGVALGTLATIGSGPILVGLLSWAFLRERPTATWWTSTLVCIAGLALLTLDGSGQPSVAIGGLALSLAAGAGYAAYTVAAKELMRRGVRSEEAMATAFGLGGVLLVPVLLVAGVAWLATIQGLAVALWLGLATLTVAYVLFGRGLRVLPAGPVATLVLAEPLVATLLGVGLLRETLGAMGWLGALLVGAGLALQGLVSVRSRS